MNSACVSLRLRACVCVRVRVTSSPGVIARRQSVAGRENVAPSRPSVTPGSNTRLSIFSLLCFRDLVYFLSLIRSAPPSSSSSTCLSISLSPNLLFSSHVSRSERALRSAHKHTCALPNIGVRQRAMIQLVSGGQSVDRQTDRPRQVRTGRQMQTDSLSASRFGLRHWGSGACRCLLELSAVPPPRP